MTQLRQRMSEDMQVRNFALNTQLSYLQQVSLFSRYFSKSPDLLGRQHLAEDCRMLPSASDWVTGFDPPGWLPCMVPPIEDLVDDDVRRHGGEATIYRELHRWFYDTKVWADGPAWFLFRHHAFGVFEAEERFGPVLGDANAPNVPTRIVAERHVQRVLGRIPPASDFLRRIC